MKFCKASIYPTSLFSYPKKLLLIIELFLYWGRGVNVSTLINHKVLFTSVKLYLVCCVNTKLLGGRRIYRRSTLCRSRSTRLETRTKEFKLCASLNGNKNTVRRSESVHGYSRVVHIECNIVFFMKYFVLSDSLFRYYDLVGFIVSLG